MAAGCGGKGRSQGRTVAHSFSNMGHEEGVAGQLQHIQAVFLVIGQASANKGLRRGEQGELVKTSKLCEKKDLRSHENTPLHQW